MLLITPAYTLKYDVKKSAVKRTYTVYDDTSQAPLAFIVEYINQINSQNIKKGNILTHLSFLNRKIQP